MSKNPATMAQRIWRTERVLGKFIPTGRGPKPKSVAEAFKKQRYSRLVQETAHAYEDPSVKILLHQGGSRTTKTHSICQFLAWLLHHEAITIQAVRRTHADLKKTGERTFWRVRRAHWVYTTPAAIA